MHGSAGHTPGRLYTETALAQLGIDVATNWQQASAQLDANHFSYLPLQTLCPRLQSLIDLRSQFGLRSPVNTLTRLLNPAKASASIQSVFHPSYTATHHAAAGLLEETQACVFKGEAGEVEYRPHANVRVMQRNKGTTRELVFPRQWERAHESRTPDTSTLLRTWRGEQEDRYGVEAVIGTTAVALLTMGKTNDVQSSVENARSLWKTREHDALAKMKTS